jgi:hypothetical protein
MLPTFSIYRSGSATGGAARRQDARTHMSFDFHDVNSSHRVRAHRTWIGQPHAGQVIHSGSDAAASAATAARRRNGQPAGTHMSFDFHGVISSSSIRAHRTSIGRPHVGPIHEISMASPVTTTRRSSCCSSSSTI